MKKQMAASTVVRNGVRVPNRETLIRQLRKDDRPEKRSRNIRAIQHLQETGGQIPGYARSTVSSRARVKATLEKRFG